MQIWNLQMRSPVLRYGLALSLVPIAILFRYALMPLLGTGEEYVTVFPAIILVAILAGRGPAIITGVLGSLAAAYFFQPALGLPAFSGAAIVILTGFLAGWLAQRLRDVLAKTETQAKALAESEQRFAAFMHHLPGAAWMKDLQGRYVYANAEAERIFSKSLQEIQGNTDEQIFSPETATQFRKNDLAALAGGSIETIEVLRQADGLDHYSIVSKFPVPGSDGKPAYVGGVAFDITERMLAQEAMKESEEKFRLLAETAQAVIGVVQGDKFVYVNPFLEHLSGYTRDELLGIDLARLIHPDYRSIVLDRARRRQAGENVESHYEFIMLTKAQEPRWLDFSVVAIRYLGKPAIVGIAFDITDRKKAEDALRVNEERLRLTTEAANVGAWTWDIVNNKNIWTDKCKDIFGVSHQAEPSIELLMTIIHPEDRQRVRRILDEAIEMHKEYDAEYRVIHPDNSIHWIHSRGRAYYDADNKKPVHAYGVITDVTGRKQTEEVVRREQAFLREVIDATPSMVFVKDWDGRFVLVNEALAACYGTTVNGIVGKTDADFNADAEEVAHFLRDDRQVMSTRQEKLIEAEPVTCADGLTRWFSTIKVPLISEDGTCNKVLGVAADITDRKRAQEQLEQSNEELATANEELSVTNEELLTSNKALRTAQEAIRESEKRYRGLFENMIDGFAHCQMLFDDDGRPVDFIYLDVNSAFGRMTGLENVAGKRVTEVIPNIRQEHPELLETYGRVARTGNPERFEIDFKPLAKLLSITVYSTQPDHFVAVFEDITDRKRIEDALFFIAQRGWKAEGEDFFASLTQYLAKATGVDYAFIGRLKEGNEVVQTVALCAKGQIQPNIEYQLAETPCRNVVGQSLRSYTADIQRSFPLDDLLRELAIESYIGMPLWDSNHRPIGLISVMHSKPLANPRPVESLLQLVAVRAAGELERRKAEEKLIELKDSLSDKNKELETIIGIVSHDLRVPILNIRGFNKFLGQDCDKIQKLLASIDISADSRKQFESILNKSMLEAVGFIETSAGAIDNLVESLVKVARAGLVVPKPETLDMNALIKNVVASIKIKFKDTGAKIDVEDLPSCLADRMHVAQIFTNLIDNAVKYLDPDRPGEICIAGKAEKDHALYWVADNGIGIAPEHQEKVFDIYYRLPEKTAVGGEGIGLSVVKRMVERNNGRIWLVSDKDKGSNFFISMPSPKQ